MQVTNQITFPTENAITGGESEISVSGKITPLSDGASLQNHGVQIRVNGVEAHFESPSSSFWTVNVPATIGVNSIQVEYTDADSSNETSNLTINNIPESHEMSATAYDQFLNVMYFAASRSRVYKLDLNSNEMTVVTVPKYSEENYFTNPDVMVFDQVNQRLLIVDRSLRKLFSVDVETGVVSDLIDLSNIIFPSGSWWLARRDLAFDSVNQILYLPESGAIFPINVAEKKVGEELALGLNFHLEQYEHLQLAYDSGSRRLFFSVPYSSNNYDSGLFSFDVQRETVTTIFDGQVALEAYQSNIVHAESGILNLYNHNGLFEFNVDTGDIEVVVGSENLLEISPYAHGFHLTNNRSSLVYQAEGEFRSFDLHGFTGGALFSSYINTVVGAARAVFSSVTYDSGGDRLLLSDGFGDIHEFDLQSNTLNRLVEYALATASSDGFPTIESLFPPEMHDIQYEDGSLYFLDLLPFKEKITRMDLSSGNIHDIFSWADVESGNLDFFGKLYYDSQIENGFEGRMYIDSAYIQNYWYDIDTNALLFSASHYFDFVSSSTDPLFHAGSLTAFYKYDIETNSLYQFQLDYFPFGQYPLAPLISNYIDGSGEVLLMDNVGQKVSSFDLATHDFSLISNLSPLQYDSSYAYSVVAYDDHSDSAWLYDVMMHGLRRIDLTSGESELVSGTSKAGGPVGTIRVVSVDVDNQLAYGLRRDGPGRDIIVVDLQSGASAVVARWQ